MEFSTNLLKILFSTFTDVLPILVLIVFFQKFVLKKPIPNLKKVVLGLAYVILGLAFFLIGLEMALFPLGDIMAKQLASPEFIGVEAGESAEWWQYYWIYIFAAMIGFSTTLAEPSLIAVAIKAKEVSAGTISVLGLRIVVAIGVAFALILGSFRIVTGTPLQWYILGGYIIVIIQTILSPKKLIALAYDSGVPLVVALGLGLSGTIPGRSAAIDGFGMIALACLFPIISVLTYVQLMELKVKLLKYKNRSNEV